MIVLTIAGVLQTIPTLAVLAIMIPIFGVGKTPAIVALFIYVLLPILNNTVLNTTFAVRFVLDNKMPNGTATTIAINNAIIDM
jgi:osmoprotectant transport system permease protein